LLKKGILIRGIALVGGQRYTWDFEDAVNPSFILQHEKLVSMYYGPGTYPSTGFRYDGYGRRTEIIEFDANGKVTSDKRYLWCGATLCQEHDMLAATIGLPGGPVTKRYFAQGVQMNGVPYYYQEQFGPSISMILMEIAPKYQGI
jgi:hypothetical protein